MESFQDTALQMLREFRKLLSNTPIPIITTRFLQFLALNMFAIEYSRPKGKLCQLLYGHTNIHIYCSSRNTRGTGLLVYGTRMCIGDGIANV